jgi:hypothetical protein
MYLFNFELKVWSSSFTLLQKRIKQIFAYIPSAATVIPEIGKATDTIKSRMLQYHDATYLAMHDQIYRNGSLWCAAPRSRHYDNTVVVVVVACVFLSDQ